MEKHPTKLLIAMAFLILGCVNDKSKKKVIFEPRSIGVINIKSVKPFNFKVQIKQDSTLISVDNIQEIQLKRKPFTIKFNTPLNYTKGVKMLPIEEGSFEFKNISEVKISDIESLNDKNSAGYSTDKKLKLQTSIKFYHKGEYKYGHLSLDNSIIDNWVNISRSKKEDEYINLWNIDQISEENKLHFIEKSIITKVKFILIYDINNNNTIEKGEYKLINIKFINNS